MQGNRKLYLAKVVGVAAAYYGTAKLGLGLAFESSSVTAVWPPTGIALAATLLWGYRIWPGVALGALLANAWTGVPFYTVLGIATGNTLEALTGAYLLRRVADFRPKLERVKDVVALVALGALVSTTVSATIGVSSLLVGDAISSSELGSVWRTWWLGDMGGDLLVAPAILIAVTHWPYRRAPGRAIEAVAAAAAVAGVAFLVFSTDTPLTYLLFPPLIWATLRFWQPGAAAASLIVAGVAIPFTQANMGPFSGNPPDDRLLLAQAFIGVCSLSGLVLAAVITERQRVEETVEYIAGTLQESLLPSRLPEVPGIETAVDFRPAGERHLVGGDFYDLFESDDGSWNVVVGDVRGKGAPAAAVTGLARYTLRAAANQEQQPSRILQVLNGAILHQRAPDEFCTVAYVRLDMDDSSGVRITAASGGHPLPLVLRADGSVQAVGKYGTALGAGVDPDLTDASADLAPGDSLIVYTDGLTDAQAPDRILTVDDLTRVVESAGGDSATEIVQRIQAAIFDGYEGEPRDDIALLVVRVPTPRVPLREVNVRLPAELTSIGDARDAVLELEAELEPAVVDNVRLLVSELVTNGIRHSGMARRSPVDLRAAVFADLVRVEVSDSGPGFEPSDDEQDDDSASGWGLYIVDRLADRWGVTSDNGTRVWFEIDR
jgi:serine phosphatase RsbU (regulator of sigma subunit)/integral membrane sensor domain MASE1/anti-sigma regulatory factor (Ser/Thr protein kinase)